MTNEEIVAQLRRFATPFDLVCASRIEAMDSALKAIIIRCEEGDKKSNWLPTIASIARTVLSQHIHGLARTQTELGK